MVALSGRTYNPRLCYGLGSPTRCGEKAYIRRVPGARSVRGGVPLGAELFQLDDALIPSRCAWIMIIFEMSSPGHWRRLSFVEASAAAMACVCH